MFLESPFWTRVFQKHMTTFSWQPKMFGHLSIVGVCWIVNWKGIAIKVANNLPCHEFGARFFGHLVLKS